MATRRSFVFTSLCIAALKSTPSFAQSMSTFEINVLSLGAVGDGTTLATLPIQQAIDRVSAAGGGRVIVPGGKRFLTGALMLKSNVDFHLADDAVLLASPESAHYSLKRNRGIINADGASNLRITGTGHVDGQGMKFMGDYSPVYERWEPLPFRPRMFHLIGCTGLEISGISFGHSPEWGLHTLGCEHVLVDGIRIRNYLDVPNCDGMDPDRCRDMEIKNCDLVCADDGIVIKTSEQTEEAFGVARNITVRDCSVTCRDSGIKIGTETFGDISKILFERCRIVSGGRGPTITHRQPGNIEDVEFRDIDFLAQHHAARWWGWGEAASVTIWPRTQNGKTGSLSDIRFKNVRGVAENSFRIDAHPEMSVKTSCSKIALSRLIVGHNIRVECSTTGLHGRMTRCMNPVDWRSTLRLHIFCGMFRARCYETVTLHGGFTTATHSVTRLKRSMCLASRWNTSRGNRHVPVYPPHLFTREGIYAPTSLCGCFPRYSVDSRSVTGEVSSNACCDTTHGLELMELVCGEGD